ncbi:MAG: recombinase family protein [Ruminococcus sp.]|nr:recombinase family protein [Ruminococcus sp.]MDE6788419.1 recombinase family protein [Ruminococcus sp.]
MKNVVAYCRVSTNKDDQLNSFEAQKEFFTEYSKQNNYNLIRIYADEGITGTSTKKRKEFNEMMNDSKKGIFECVLVKDISRFARNTVDCLQSIRELSARDINVKFITSYMNTIEGNELTLTMLAAIAQEESANMSKRVKFGKRINAEKGKVPNSCYGYIKTKGDYFNLQINESEAEVVREIFDLYVNKGYGTHKISKVLNDRGLTSLRGIAWSTTAVSRLLKNKIYAGYVINGRTEVKNFIEKTRRIKDESEWFEVEKPDLRIIPLELWEKAQNINKSNNIGLETTIHQKRSNKHLFSTLITCSVCGYSFRRVQNKRKDHIRTYWCCSGRNHHGAKYCRNTTIIMENELIENIDNYFLSLIEDKQKFVSNIISQYKREQPENSDTALNKRLGVLQKKKQKQIQMFENDIITIEELKERTADIDRQIAKIRLELDIAETPEDIEKKLNQLYHKLSENFDKYSSVANMTNSELKTLIRGITADENGNINIELNY